MVDIRSTVVARASATMAPVNDLKRMFDTAEFCETVKAAVGEGRISSNLALRDGAAAMAAVKCLEDFSNRASARIGPDVVAAYVSYSPGAAEVFTALRAISVNLELVSAALECLICIVRYSLDASRPPKPLEQTRSIVKEIVKSRAALIYDILATDGRACAKKALNLLRLAASCHPMLVKELVNRFDLTAKSMAPSLCSITNNHCRVPFLDLMVAILASEERDVFLFLTGKGREVIVTCLRTIQERAMLEAKGGAGSSTKSIMWRQGKAHQNKRPKILPSHVQKRELVAAINFLRAIDKHLLKGETETSQGVFAHPIPTLLAILAVLERPPLDVAPREVQPEHKLLRSTATRMFLSLVNDTRKTKQDDIVKALSNPALNFGTKPAVSFVCKVVRRRPDLAAPLLQGGRILSTPPALTLRWFGHFSVIAFCTLRLQKLVTSFKDKQYFERCLSSTDPLIRHLGCTIALYFCKVVGRYLKSEESADYYLPPLDVLQRTAKPGAKDVNLFQRLVTSYQSLFQAQDELRIDVKQMIACVDAAGEDTKIAARAIEGTLRSFPHTAVRKIVRKGYLSKLIVKASQSSQNREAIKLWRVCGLVLLSTDLFQPGTEDEIDVYLSVLSSLGKEAEPLAKAFEAVIAQALDMPYGLYDRLHSPEWSDEGAAVKTSLLSVATIIKLQKLEESCSSNVASKGNQLVHKTLRKMVLSVVAMYSVLHNQEEPKSYLTFILPSFMKAEDIYWKRTRNRTDDADRKSWPRERVEQLLHELGTYPKTELLNLIETLAVFDHRVHTKQEFPNINAKPDLGVAWDSWCDHRVLHHSDWRQYQSAEQSRLRKYEPVGGSVVFEGLFRLLLQATYPGRIGTRQVEDLELLREALTSSDYRFVACVILRTVGSGKTRRQAFEEVLTRASDQEHCDELHPEEAEFLYETVVRTIAGSPTIAASEVKSVASFCISILSRWDSFARWELHVAYSIAMMKALLFHSSIEIALRVKVFLASSIVERLPPIIEFTPRAANGFLMLLEYCPSLRDLAFAQVLKWTEKDFRNCNGVLLRLMSDAIHSVGRITLTFEYQEKLIEKLLKATSKSKTEWISMKSNEDDVRNLRALQSLACIIAGSRKLCKFFLHRLVDKELVSANSWVLLGLVIGSSDTSMNRAEIANQEYAKLFFFVLKHIKSVSESNESPTLHCVQVLGSVARLLRLKKFSLYSIPESSDGSLTLLCNNLTLCTQSRFAMIVSNPEPVEESVSSQNLTHLLYITSTLTSQAEVLRLDLSLEHAARETVLSLLQKECEILRYCLQTNLSTRSVSNYFLRVLDVVVAFMLVIKASLPWLPNANGDSDLAQSLLTVHALMRSRSHEIASGRSEKESTIRECLTGLSNYISAGNLQQGVSATTNQSHSAGTEAATVASGLPKFMLEETADYVLKTSYHFAEPSGSLHLQATKTLDPFFALNTFLCGCRQALLQPHAPVLDLQRVTSDGLFALSVTGIASTDRKLRILSFACLEAFTAVVGPVTGVPVGSASALYKDRRQLAFLLELLRNSISDPLTPVLPLFAVWFRSAARIALTPTHAANKLVSTYLLRAPCMDVSDCYGLSYYFNCGAGGSELTTVTALAFDIIQQGVRSERDVAVVRRRRIFDKMFMFSASAMGFDDTIRLAALRSLEALILRDGSLNITEELVGGHGIAAWISSSAEQVGETMEEILIKLNILGGIARNYVSRGYQSYASVLAEALKLFIISRLTPKLAAKDAARVAQQTAKCGAQIARMVPERRHIFGIDFSDLWIAYGSKTILSLEAKWDFVRCICKQRNVAMQPGVLELLLEFTIRNDRQNNEQVSQNVFEDLDSHMVDMFIAECMLSPENRSTLAKTLTADFCRLLGVALHRRDSIWLLVTGVRTLDLSGHLNEKIMACTDKIPAFVPEDVAPRFEEQCHSTVKDMKLTVVEALVNLCDVIMNATEG